MSVLEHEDINNYIVEYLKVHGMSKTADTIQQEIKSISLSIIDKYVVRKNKIYTKGLEVPRLIALKKTNYSISKKEVNL